MLKVPSCQSSWGKSEDGDKLCILVFTSNCWPVDLLDAAEALPAMVLQQQ